MTIRLESLRILIPYYRMKEDGTKAQDPRLRLARRMVATGIGATWLSIVSPANTKPLRLSDVVNPLRGSNSSREYSRGNTFPAVALPFGFNFWTPFTEGNSDRWLYRYGMHSIEGFGVTHEPSPWIGDHASFQIMPMTRTLRLSPEARASRFSHSKEIARPYYYGVTLDDSGITTEFTPTDHASAWRFAFPNSEPSFLLFDLIDTAVGDLSVNVLESSVQGYVDQNGPRFYFFVRLDTSIQSSGSTSGKGANAWVQVTPKTNEAVTLSIGTSYISIDQAKANLAEEIGTRTFDQVREQAQRVWDEILSKIELKGETDEERTQFYSNLYRAFLYPNSMYERVGDQYKYFSPYSHTLKNGKLFVNNGFWDTYRAEWPLLSLLLPSRTGEMLQGFVAAYEDGGWAPRWSGPGYVDCMLGSSSDSVFADAILRGITNFDIRTAYESMLRNAMTVSSEGAKGRRGNEQSIFLGYVPADRFAESAAWTLEDSINDFGIGNTALLVGDATYAEYFRNRALRYSMLFSPSVGFFRGRRVDGQWRTPDSSFFPNEWGNEFTEGAAWQYITAPAIDFQGVANLFGGRAQLASKVDEMLAAPREYRVGSYGQPIHEMLEAHDADMGQYAHPNEPVHSTLYAYDYAGKPWKTQAAVREVMQRLYSTGIGTGDGYLGDEDNGQMSAWYVFSALGFYPASPGHAEYAIGSPLYPEAMIHLESGTSFRISARNTNQTNKYVRSARLNGLPYSKVYLPHESLVHGGNLEFEMDSRPSRWGTSMDALPKSMTPVSSGRMPVMRVDLARGGTVSASSEEREKGGESWRVFDDDSRTIWQAAESKPTVQYRFPEGRMYTVSLYTVTSAATSPEKDPKSWMLQGSQDCLTWTTLDTRTNERFGWRSFTKVYASRNTTPFSCYRFAVTANGGAATTQVAELELIGDAPISTAIARSAPGCSANTGSTKATDASRTTKWCSDAQHATLVVDLGGQHAINQVMIHHAESGGEAATLNTRDYSIEASPDGKSWARIAEKTGNHDAVTQHTFSPTVASAIRLTIDKPSQSEDHTTRIYEFEVFGKWLGPNH